MKVNRLYYKLYSYLLISISIGFFLINKTVNAQESQYVRDNYPNLIDYKFTPLNAKDKSIPFADLGAWHSINLPDSDPQLGVNGPYLLGEFRLAGPYLTAFAPEIDGEMHHFDQIIPTSFPGMLRIDGISESVEAVVEVFYISDRTHLSLVKLKNKSASQLSIKPNWYGKVFAPFEMNTQEQSLTIPTNKGLLQIDFQQAELFNIELVNDTFYSAVFNKAITFEPGETLTYSAAVTYLPYGEKNAEALDFARSALQNPYVLLQANENRWNNYLQKITRTDVATYDYVPVKALQTLITNWKTPTGDLVHQGLVPSMAVSYFYGFWSWDSWKHAVALVNFDSQLAKDQIITMFDFQDENGMVADCVYPDATENNWRDTKPPLASWAVDEVFEATGDTTFMLAMLPKLVKYHNWWYDFRDHDHNGLCEFGSTDGTLIAAKWESGMDNAVRFDDTKMLFNTENAWSMDQESIDLNAYLYLEKVLLAKLLRVAGKNEQALLYDKAADELKNQINTHFYDKKTGFYYDRKIGSGELIKIAGPEGWTPLWCQLASPKQVEEVSVTMLNTNRFNTFVPLPTLDVSHPKYTYNGYWRGTVWLDQVYFGISALRKNGKQQEADQLTRKVFENLGGLSGDGAIYENYDPHSGEALEAPNFSWSAAHLLMMYLELEK
ncbi:MAG: glycoside hydrolase [Bacteroidales bacterium]|nr:glycoside hydrolase [Bacteroidales bacterium]